jgi:hypothetical protein
MELYYKRLIVLKAFFFFPQKKDIVKQFQENAGTNFLEFFLYIYIFYLSMLLNIGIDGVEK